VIVGSRTRPAHSRQVVALCVITFIGTLMQLGLCAMDLPTELDVSDMLAHAPAGACWFTGADRSVARPVPDLSRLLRDGLSARAILAQQRTAALTSIGVVAGPLLLATWMGGTACLARARRWSRAADVPGGRAGAGLLVRLCISRT
jgi:hypothetical protein